MAHGPHPAGASAVVRTRGARGRSLTVRRLQRGLYALKLDYQQIEWWEEERGKPDRCVCHVLVTTGRAGGREWPGTVQSPSMLTAPSPSPPHPDFQGLLDTQRGLGSCLTCGVLSTGKMQLFTAYSAYGVRVE